MTPYTYPISYSPHIALSSSAVPIPFSRADFATPIGPKNALRVHSYAANPKIFCPFVATNSVTGCRAYATEISSAHPTENSFSTNRRIGVCSYVLPRRTRIPRAAISSTAGATGGSFSKFTSKSAIRGSGTPARHLRQQKLRPTKLPAKIDPTDPLIQSGRTDATDQAMDHRTSLSRRRRAGELPEDFTSHRPNAPQSRHRQPRRLPVVSRSQ